MTPLALTPFRFILLMAMSFSVVGAGWAIVLGVVFYSFATWYETNVIPAAALVLIGVAGVVSALVAIYGLLAEARRPALFGAAAQGVAAGVALLGSLGGGGSGQGAQTFMLFALLLLFVDAAVVVWARRVPETRTS